MQARPSHRSHANDGQGPQPSMPGSCQAHLGKTSGVMNIATLIDRLFSKVRRDEPTRRVRLVREPAPDVIYAIGDVHGCLDLLAALEARILEDARSFSGTKLIVMLGDYVDRGPASAQVLDHLLADPPKGFERTCLAGNHEQEMLAVLSGARSESNWLSYGGRETLISYGIAEEQIRGLRPGSRKMKQVLAAHIPDEHLAFLAALPIVLVTKQAIFVHAAIPAGLSVEEMDDRQLLWDRGADSTPGSASPVIVHGHVPSGTVELSGGRIGVDTGAFTSGVLSALRMTGDGKFAVLTTRDDGAAELPVSVHGH